MKANPCRKRRLFLIANKLVSVITLIFFSAGTVFALPAGQQVVNGQAAFNTQGNNLTITNSPNAIINWQGFSINNNEAVRFIQQYGSSAVLNRVIGQDPSRILGLLQSNGRVFLINPSGILFGQGARIDVNGLIASTLNISNQDFLAGKYNFTAGSIAGSIQNQGTITTPEGGKVYLIAPDIENSGIITTPKGEVLLAAGHSVQLVDSLDPDIAVVVSAPENKAVNLGQIVAQSGKVGIYGGLISQRGIVNADSAVVGENGRIFFKASKDVTLDAGSTTSARGGTIEVLGNMESGTVRVSGALDASAPNGGDGGFIETSAAHVKVDDSARITTLAPYGKAGMWLLDPYDFTIAASGGDITGTALSTALGSNSVTIQTLAGSVSCTGATCGAGTSGLGDIFVNDTVSWSANTLTLSAYRNIYINSILNGSGAAKLALEYGQGAINAGNTATYFVNAPVSLPAGPASPFPNFSTKLGSDGTPVNFTVITSLGAAGSTTGTDLQGMNGSPTVNYALGSNIDASSTSGWNSGMGFMPVGSSGPPYPFSGVFDGLGHTITGLSINRPTTDYVGLFGYTGSSAIIRNVGLVNGTITGQSYVGGLVGYNYSNISTSYSTGAVNGTTNVGGLVGTNSKTISNSYSTGAVSGTTNVGGLVGNNAYSSSSSLISNSYSTGAVNGTTNVGGLVGTNSDAAPANSYWDTQTSGQATSAGGTGLTTAQMKTQSSFTGWDFTDTWRIVEGSSYYPYLKWQPHQTISGMLDAASAGNIIYFFVDGTLFLGQTSTIAGGLYSIEVPGNPVPNNSALLVYVYNDPVKGASVYLAPGGDITNLLLSSNTVTASSGGGTMSNTTLGTAKGSLSSGDIPYSVSGTDLTLSPNFNFKTASGTTYSINGNITTTNGAHTYNGPLTLLGNAVISAGTGNISFSGPVTGIGYNFTLNSQGMVTQTAPISVSGLELLGTGGTYNLTDVGNAVTTLAGNTGAVNFTNSTGIGIGTVNTAGLTTSGDFTLKSGGAITQSTPLQVGGALKFDAGATNDITLTNAGNILSSVWITSGKDVSLTNTGALVMNASTVSGTLGVTAGGNITQTGALAVTGAATFDAGATHDITLTNVGNNFSGVGITSGKDVSLTNTGALALNASTVSGTLDVTAGGHITQTGVLAVNNNATLNAQGTASDIVINGIIDETGGNVALNVGGNVALNATGNIGLNGDVLANGGIEIHADGDVTQNAGSIANTIAGSTAPGSYDINISGHDVNLRSVASQRDIDVTAQSLTVGNIQALGSQGFHVDDQYFTYLLPFSFSFYDTPYSTAYISSNGIITFGSGTSAYSDSTSYLPYYKIIASAWNDWDTRANSNFTNPLDVYVSSTSGALAVRWDVARYPVTSQSAQFETVLYNNGNIKFNYGPANTSFAGDVTIGLSNQSSASTLVSQLMSQPNFSMNNLRSTTFSYASESGQYSETLSAGSDWNATMPGGGTGGITSLGNITLNSAGSIAINGIVNAGNNLKLAGAGIVSQMAPITAAGLELLGAEATYNLTHTGNAITTLAGNTGTVHFTNSTGIGIGTVNTTGLATSGDLTLNSGGAITQSAPLQVVGVATFDAGAGNDITLTNPGNNFGSVGITSGKDVSLTDTDSLALNASTVNNSLSATAGGDITLNGLINAGTGNITLNSGGAIINGMGSLTSISAGYFFAEAVNGIGSGDPLMTGVQNINAVNTTLNNIEIDNTGALAVSVLSNGGTGNVILQNIGAITTDTSTVTSSGGSVSITAHSPLTIGAGGVSAYSSISLEASPSGGSDNLTINGNIASSNGNIILSAGSGIVIGPGIVLSAPNGTITLNGGTSTTGTGNLVVTGNATATDNTVSSLMTAMANITSIEERDDENELTTETREGGERTTDDKKTDASVKNYCN